MNRRRIVLFGAIAAASSLPAIVRAQTTTVSGCGIGFVNGILQFAADCPLLSPPGLPFDVAPPSHMLPAPVSTADVPTPQEERIALLDRRRERRRAHADRQRQQRKRRRDQKQNQREKRQTSSQTAFVNG